MHELVRIGEPETVAAWRDAWLDRVIGPASGASGSRPGPRSRPTRSSGAAGRMLAANQRAQELKFELVALVGGPEPTAIASFNYHQDHFTRGLRDRPRRRRASPTPAASASASSGSPSRCSGPTGWTWPPGRPRCARSCGRDRRGMVSLFGHDPATYTPHWLHAGDRTYLETNCFTDIVIELLHARGDEPAGGARVVRPDGLRERPVDVLQAVCRWTSRSSSAWTSTRCSRTGRSPSRSRSCSALGRTMTVELDAWYLPDTAATSYGNAHVKTGGHRRVDRPRRRAVPLLPQRLAVRAGRRRLPRHLPPGAGLVRGRAAAVPRAHPLRRGPVAARRGPAGGGARPAPRPPRPDRAGQPVRAVRRAPAGGPADDPRRATTSCTTPTRSPRSGWPAPASSSCASHVDWLLGEDGAHGVGGDGARSSTAARCSASSWRDAGRSTRARPWPACAIRGPRR